MKRSHIMIVLIVILFVFCPLYSQLILEKSIADKLGSYCYGDIAKDHVDYLARLDRSQRTAGFQKGVEYVVRKAKGYGLEDVHVESYPWDGKAEYFTFTTGETWQPIKGELRMVSPQYKILAELESRPTGLARNSKSTDVTAELVYIENPRDEESYTEEDIKGKIVLTPASTGTAARALIGESRALGVVSFTNPVPFWDSNRRPWEFIHQLGYSSIPKSVEGFGFAVDLDTGNKLKEKLLRGQKIQVHAIVKSEYKLEDNKVVSAMIKGTDLPDEEVVLISHLCHTKPAANDNASGSAANLEVAHTILSMVDAGVMPRPRRSIRFLWVGEWTGTSAWLSKHIDDPLKRLTAINLDMVGENQKLTDSRVNISRSPNSCASYVNALVENLHEVLYKNNQERHTDSPYTLHSFTGSRNAWNAAVVPYIWGSDHDMFVDGSVGVPAVCLSNWPDNFYHSSEDSPDKVDPTQLTRAIFFASALSLTVANADDRTAESIVLETVKRSQKSIGNYFLKAGDLIISADAEGLPKAYYNAAKTIEYGIESEKRAVASIKNISSNMKNVSVYIGQLNKMKKGLKQQLTNMYRQRCKSLGIRPDNYRLTDEETAASKKVPVRNPEKKGPVFIMNLQPRIEDQETAKNFGKAVQWFFGMEDVFYSTGILAEIVNFCDGKRDLLTIRDELTAEYSPVPLWVVTHIYDGLEMLEYIEFR